MTKVEEPQVSPNPPLTRESYTLDKEGNRVNSHASSFVTLEACLRHDVTAPTNRLVEDEQHTYEYDVMLEACLRHDGNMVSKVIKATGQQWVYTYDALDRMTRSERRPAVGSTTFEMRVDYTYDAFDRRWQKVAQPGPTGAITTTLYTHDADNVLMVQERTGSGARKRQWFSQAGLDSYVVLTPATGFVTSLSGPGTASYYYSTDHLGSVRSLHDDAGQVVADLDHDTYGNSQVAVETVAQPFRFTGREYDRETGLYYYRARMYDSESGRFLQEDPLWLEARDYNFYRYVFGRPLKYRDPDGKEAVEYACMSAFGELVGSAGGLSSGTGLAGVFYKLNATLMGILHGSAGVALAKKVAEDSISDMVAIATGSSFSSDTLIATRDGPKRIDEVEVGELVRSVSERTGIADWRRITELRNRTEPRGIIKLTVERVGPARPGQMMALSGPRIATETVKVTSNHPYLLEDGKWVTAEKLQVGNRLQSVSGYLRVVAKEYDEASTRVFNVVVEKDHTYAVGALQAWVHNPGPGSGEWEIIKEWAREYLRKGGIPKIDVPAFLELATGCGMDAHVDLAGTQVKGKVWKDIDHVNIPARPRHIPIIK